MSGKAPDLTAEAEALARALLDPVYYEMGYGYEPTVEHLALISQALAAVDQRAYARGIEDASKVAEDIAAKNAGYSDGPGAARVFAAIRQLLEVKG